MRKKMFECVCYVCSRACTYLIHMAAHLVYKDPEVVVRFSVVGENR